MHRTLTLLFRLDRNDLVHLPEKDTTPFLPLSDLPNNVLRDTTKKANT
jgi:hypothetical protein